MWDVGPAEHRDRLAGDALERLAAMRDDDDGRIQFTQHVRYTLGRRPG